MYSYYNFPQLWSPGNWPSWPYIGGHMRRTMDLIQTTRPTKRCRLPCIDFLCAECRVTRNHRLWQSLERCMSFVPRPKLKPYLCMCVEISFIQVKVIKKQILWGARHVACQLCRESELVSGETDTGCWENMVLSPDLDILSSDWDWAWAWDWVLGMGMGIGDGNWVWEMGMGKSEWK